jgi:nicotinamidase-related amidase
MVVLLCLSLHPLLRASDPASQARRFRLPLRTQVQPFKGSSAWEAARLEHDFSTGATAIVICDMWDNHWCAGATRRVNELAHKMEPVLEVCRAAGILIVHAPSDTMDFYKDYPQRRVMQLLTPATPPAGLGLTSPGLPIDDSDGGCDTPGNKEHQVWTRENPLLSMKADDVISDNGGEIYTLLQHKGIKNLFVMGDHANMCILNRTFAIKQMTNWGISCVLVRDLTDAMYNPRSRPYVSHAAGTEMVIEYIEKYWCPTTLSGDLVHALSQ